MVRALENVLVAEDDDDARDIVEVTLTLEATIKVRAFSSGAAALDHLRTAPAPDLILLGTAMAGLDGPATLAQIRRMFALARVPAVFLAANADGAEGARLMSLGAAGIIAKPLDPLRLPQQVQDIWQRHAASAPSPAVAAKFAELGRKFREQLTVDARTLRTLAARVASAEPAELRDSVQEIQSIAHRIRGAAGSFGAAEIGDAAGAVERAAIDTLDAAAMRITDRAAVLRATLDRFHSTYLRAADR